MREGSFSVKNTYTRVSVITIKRFACKPLVTQIQKIDFVYSCFAKLTENWFLGHHTDRSQCKNKFEKYCIIVEKSHFDDKNMGNIIDFLEKTLKSRGYSANNTVYGELY